MNIEVRIYFSSLKDKTNAQKYFHNHSILPNKNTITLF